MGRRRRPTVKASSQGDDGGITRWRRRRRGTTTMRTEVNKATRGPDNDDIQGSNGEKRSWWDTASMGGQIRQTLVVSCEQAVEYGWME